MRHLMIAFKSYHAKVKEDLRQIQREQGMVDPGKLVMRAAFDACFGDADRQGTALTDFERRHHLDYYKSQINHPDLVIYAIPATLLTPKDQAVYGQEKDVIKSCVSKWKKYKEDSVLTDSEIKIVDQSIARNEEDLAGTSASAAYLGILLQSWNDVYDGHNALKMEGRVLALTKQGSLMVDFWKAVNALDDYSYLFPGSTPPGAKKKQQQEEVRGIRALFPGLQGFGA